MGLEVLKRDFLSTNAPYILHMKREEMQSNRPKS